jgi:hypothetical protein
MANYINKNVPRVAIGAFYGQENCDITLSVTSAKDTGHDFIILPITHSNYKRFLFDQVDKDINDMQVNDNTFNNDKQHMEEWRKGHPFLKDDLIIKDNGNLFYRNFYQNSNLLTCCNFRTYRLFSWENFRMDRLRFFESSS